ncbi:MAG: RagB/SusD family nutrient uptake outer membrane protein, partial [Chitinophagaceae bacterium]|nr:RagB/SusD family nutrient uptake outer membrane protein [Chitinophagaceae bacterium]
PSALGIPYTTTSDISAKPARQPVSEVITAIEDELATAKNAPLPGAPPVTPTVGTIRLSKAAITGFQARVALYKEEWSKAETFATEAINFAAKPLANMAEYPLIWTDESESEIIWKLRRTGTSVGTLWQDNNDDVFFEPSDKLKNLYDRDNDIRFETFFLINNPGDDDTALINKFRASVRGLRINDVKMMRTSELYLIRAEARAEQDNLTGAADDYNMLRRQRITGYVDESFGNKTEAIMAILNERARELAFEGFRFFDLKRRGLPINRLPSDVQSSEWLNLPADNFRFLFPIPQRSILANPNMVQNPGY